MVRVMVRNRVRVTVCVLHVNLHVVLSRVNSEGSHLRHRVVVGSGGR